MDARGAYTALDAPVASEQLTDGGSSSGANAALGHRVGRGGPAGETSGIGAGPDVGADDTEVEQDRRRHDGDAGVSELDADSSLLEVLHYAGGGCESERAASAQKDGVNAVDHGSGRQKVCLPRAGS